MAAIFRLMAVILHLTVGPMSESIHTSYIVLLDPENVGVAVRISLLSYTQAEILDLAYVLLVNGGHVWFTILHLPATRMSESIHSSLTVLIDADNVGVAVGFPLPATVPYLLFDLLVFPVLHTLFDFQ
jgi:hypothetical protein